MIAEMGDAAKEHHEAGDGTLPMPVADGTLQMPVEMGGAAKEHHEADTAPDGHAAETAIDPDERGDSCG